MILILAVFTGLLAGFGAAAWNKRSYALPSLELYLLVPLAVIPQLLVFSIPSIGNRVPDMTAAAVLVLSLVTLLEFVWFNRRLPGFWLLLIGLLMNLSVILANGGFMPMRTDLVSRLLPDVPASLLQAGVRLTGCKDIIMPSGSIHLEMLSDRFLVSFPFAYQVVFSMGDMLIATGVFWFLWKPGIHKPDVAAWGQLRQHYSSRPSMRAVPSTGAKALRSEFSFPIQEVNNVCHDSR